MDKLKTTFTRLDPAEVPKRPRSLDQFSDEEIKAADGLILVDPEQPDWQRLLWSAPIADGMATSMMMRIVEIAVNSGDEGQIDAARRRVGKLKKVEKQR